MPSSTSTPIPEQAGAIELARLLAERKIGALELCDATIARIEQRDQEINAVVVRDFDRARDAARAADAALARGERKPLLGVPMTVKESFDVAGLPTTWGFAEFADYRPEADALAVTRLKDAGAVILGKTNVPVALGDWQTVHPLYGRTNNPLDLTRSPGGSSGGSAAALASYMVPLELGSDIGGSIRIPAHFCGLYGHKPSLGLLPVRGHKPPRADGAGSGLAVIGPLARNVDDLTLAFDLLAVADPLDPGLRVDLGPPRVTSPRGARLLVIDTHPRCATDADTRHTLAALAAEFERAGAVVARTSPLLPDLDASHKLYIPMLLTEINRAMPERQPQLSANQWLGLLDARHRLRQQWAALFREFDAVITPVFGTPAFVQFGDEPWPARQLSVDGAPTPYGDQLAWPGLATVSGLPATIAPAGKSKEGLPIGVQIIGPWQEDRTPLTLAGIVGELRR
jgi:amidase